MKKMFLFFLLLSVQAFSSCGYATCDRSIIYAMSKERNAVSNRINDMIRTLNDTISETKINNALMALDAIEFIRLRERFKIRYVDVEKQNHTFNIILKNIDLLASLQTIKNKTKLEIDNAYAPQEK